MVVVMLYVFLEMVLWSNLCLPFMCFFLLLNTNYYILKYVGNQTVADLHWLLLRCPTGQSISFLCHCFPDSISHNSPCLGTDCTAVSYQEDYNCCTQTYPHCRVVCCMWTFLSFFMFTLALPCLCFSALDCFIVFLIVCCLPWPLPVFGLLFCLVLDTVVCWCWTLPVLTTNCFNKARTWIYTSIVTPCPLQLS